MGRGELLLASCGDGGGGGGSGTGARGSYKNFVREECKQCPDRTAQLFAFDLVNVFRFPTFCTFFDRARARTGLCTREYRFPYANSRQLGAKQTQPPLLHDTPP